MMACADHSWCTLCVASLYCAVKDKAEGEQQKAITKVDETVQQIRKQVRVSTVHMHLILSAFSQ